MRPVRQRGLTVAEARMLYLSFLSAVIGVVCGVVAFGLYHLIGLVTNLLYYQRYSWEFTDPRFHHLGAWAILIPAVAGLVIGAMVQFGSPKISGHGIPEAMEAILLNKSRITPAVAILKPTSAALAIGSGGPFGAEGPIIQTGGAIGSILGQFLRVTPAERKVLLACGAGAGMAATFSTPIAAVIIAIELLLFEFKTRSFIPLCIASVIATGVRFQLVGTGPMFHATPATFGSLAVLPFYLVLGIAAGLSGAILTKALYLSEDVFDRVNLPLMVLPAIGGLGVGILGFFVPRILGVGYDSITDILAGTLGAALLIKLALAKAAALCVSLGSKTSGGVLAPILMVGGAIGALFGMGAHRLFPGLAIAPGTFALVCMAAVFAATTRATFTSIVFAFELTRDYKAVLPLMFACVIADVTASLFSEHSIMTEKLVRRGVRVPTEYEADVLGGMRVDEVMTAPALTLPASTPVRDVLKHIGGRIEGEPAHQAYPIIDRKGDLVGIVARSDVMDLPDRDLERRTVGDIATKDLVVGYPDEALHEALAKLLNFDIGHLPIVKRGDPKTIVGFLTRSDILKARHRRMAEELQQEQVYHPHWPHRVNP